MFKHNPLKKQKKHHHYQQQQQQQILINLSTVPGSTVLFVAGKDASLRLISI